MLKETAERLSSPTPEYFKKLIKLSLLLGGAGATIMALPATLAASGIAIILPAILTKAAGYMITAGVVGASLSKLTVGDAKVNGAE